MDHWKGLKYKILNMQKENIYEFFILEVTLQREI